MNPSWWTIDGGGVTFATGGTFNLGGTVGQPDTSDDLAGGAFRISGGWANAQLAELFQATVSP
jgi:hypothetical protein